MAGGATRKRWREEMRRDERRVILLGEDIGVEGAALAGAFYREHWVFPRILATTARSIRPSPRPASYGNRHRRGLSEACALWPTSSIATSCTGHGPTRQ